MPKYYLYIFFFLLSLHAYAQEFNYVHFDTKQGLAGSTVYDICQDQDGFIWFGTENGLSRFDGSNFKNFTVKDGLPDNEILKLFADSKGRVWLGPFSKNIAYIYKNKIYTVDNDSTLRKVHLKSNVYIFFEDSRKNIWVCDGKLIVQITADNEVITLNDQPALKHLGNLSSMVVDHFKKDIFIMNDQDMYRWDGINLSYLKKRVYPPGEWLLNNMDPDGRTSGIYAPATVLSENRYPGSYRLHFANTVDGSYAFDTSSNKFTDHFLPGRKVSNSFIDTEQNTWFSTLGEGIYKMPSKGIKTIKPAKQNTQYEPQIYSITKFEDHIIAGMNNSKAMLVKDGQTLEPYDYSAYLSRALNSRTYNRLSTLKLLSTGDLILGFDNFLVKKSGTTSTLNFIEPIKTVCEIDKEHILVGTSRFAFKVKLNGLEIIDTIWRERCTNVFVHDQKYYIGTLTGLYEVNEDKRFKYLGDLSPFLKRRINDITADADGIIWVATNDEGVVGYQHGKIIRMINDKNGFSSNICKTLFVKDEYLWIGTNKGLNKVNLHDDKKPVIKYSVADGLPSDIINAVYIDDDLIWLGTPAGLVYFKEKDITSKSVCKLVLLGVTIADSLMPVRNDYNLSYKENSILIEYSGISFKSGKELIYHYNLEGLDSEWRETSENTIDYSSLPPGDYTFNLYAQNKYGVKSNAVQLHFSIAKPFWQRWWFYLLVLLTVATFTAIIVNHLNKKNRARIEEKRMFQNQFAILEQQALQAQMNPHFIFNCLSSIQQYILTNDRQKANQYLTDFSSLIRQTLDNSGKRTISLADEINYLDRYLQMEQMRFGDSFSFGISVHPDVQINVIQIPAMLFQPFVENALRHGIRYKKEGFGKVLLYFSVDAGVLLCSVKDNGVGRQKAAEHKSHQPIEYQSKGVELTSKRIELLNKINEYAISVQIIDLLDEQGQPSGTEVIIKIPV